MKWSRTVGSTALLNIGGQLAAWVCIWVVASIVFWSEFEHNIWTDPFFMWPLLAVVLISVIVLPLSKRRWAGVWHSTSVTVKEPPHLVIPKLERTLTECGVAFGSIWPPNRRSMLEFNWDEVYQLDTSALKMHITGWWGRTRVHVGPVTKTNKAAVERVKMLVEKALA